MFVLSDCKNTCLCGPPIANGIAFDAENTRFYVSGMYWQHKYELELFSPLSGVNPLTADPAEVTGTDDSLVSTDALLSINLVVGFAVLLFSIVVLWCICRSGNKKAMDWSKEGV